MRKVVGAMIHTTEVKSGTLQPEDFSNRPMLFGSSFFLLGPYMIALSLTTAGFALALVVFELIFFN
jgi:hypothetical protein